jgi:PAS domain S-box-containing protein
MHDEGAHPVPVRSGARRPPAPLGDSPATPSDLFYRAFVESRDAIEVTDRNGILVDVNPAFERIYGYRREECIGKRPNMVRSTKTPKAVYEALWKQLLDPNGGHWTGEITNVDRHGVEHVVLLSIQAVRNAAGEIVWFIGIATDLSEVRLLQLATIRQERLASLGQLAAGVAHEINTPLANIQLVAESLTRRSTDPWIQARAATIGHQVEVAATIVRGLLDFARDTPTAMIPSDLVATTREAVAFLRGKHSAELVVVERHGRPSLPIRANPIQIQQVLVNLVNNGADAMEDRGELVVETRADDGYAEVAVTDRGTGIPDAVRSHLFEPFFTTKPPGKGTGLGLSICHGIVRAHGGEIQVTTEVGRGSTFTVRLPLLRNDGAGGR